MTKALLYWGTPDEGTFILRTQIEYFIKVYPLEKFSSPIKEKIKILMKACIPNDPSM